MKLYPAKKAVSSLILFICDVNPSNPTKARIKARYNLKGYYKIYKKKVKSLDYICG
jgi:hypothetical protein